MPGIAGIISFRDRLPSEKMIAQMVETMMHEPSYHFGIHIEKEMGLACAWTSHQRAGSRRLPAWNLSKNICLLFVGEHFEDAAEMPAGTKGGTAADNAGVADRLIALYEEGGAKLFEKLNGTFSGLLIDFRTKEIFLFNDRYGLSRIYYHQTAEAFFFASEAKALLKVLPETRGLDMKGLGEFFACHCVLQDRSLFKKVSVLPPGSVWTFNRGGIASKRRCFQLEALESQSILSESDYYEKLEETFRRVLPRYLRADDKIAMSLTGGLDSRMIMAWARRDPSTLPCYSHRGMFRECLDARIGRRVARVCGQEHRTITVGDEFLREFPTLAERAVYVTDGAMDVSGATGIYVNRIAREQIAPVRLTGNYGGEILRHLIALGPAKLKNPFLDKTFMSYVSDGKDTLTRELNGERPSFIAFKQVPWHHYARFCLESSQLTIRSPYLDNELVALSYQAPRDLTTNRRLAERLITEGNPGLASFPTDRGPLGRSGVFGKARQMFQEFTFKADYAYDYGMPHWLSQLNRALSPLHLEKVFLGRHKYYHFRHWYRTTLAPYVKEVLLDPRALSRPYLDRRSVETMVNAHVTGRGNYTSEIHALLGMELLQRQLIERS